ncbi:MAG TPA: PDZ domain-containing protein [Kofleriaceae bacterium]
MELLGALVVVGCGSSAMAAPGHGYWTGYDDQSQTTPYQDPNHEDQDQNQTQTQTPSQTQSQSSQAQPYQQAPYPYQGQPYQATSPQNVGTPDPWDNQSQPSQSQPSQSQPSQSQPSQSQPSQSQPGQSQPSQSQPSQSQPQGQQGQDTWSEDDQDEDSADTSSSQPRLGVLVMPMTPDLRRHFGAPVDRGVLIARVEPNSAASRAGIQVGDVLVRVGRQRVRSGDDVVQALTARGGGRIPLSVIRAGQLVRLDATMAGPRRQAPDRSVHAL